MLGREVSLPVTGISAESQDTKLLTDTSIKPSERENSISELQQELIPARGQSAFYMRYGN